ncbi:hypothetical protein RY831_27690 [Noviherbaspirillum sp. CPCC 100848]|uniref:KOW domain-containing protein n=1 Tax=Noviherbaspirillum album TaxID=3080276 RepID=A0ABU6JGZ1_9BURK|nr:hypothetical protein [Noviherbaspirillum sp. CPCC 100848]MEC4722947.1 hypothetical protein [Noviherbaspirillum sp. CPCC 100848]
MKKGDQVRVNETVRVNVGKLSGLAGVVQAVEGDTVTVHISGVKDGEEIDVTQQFNEKALGRLNYA